PPACGIRAMPVGGWRGPVSNGESPDRVQEDAGGGTGFARAASRGAQKGGASSNAHETTSRRVEPAIERRRHRGAHRRKAEAPLSTGSEGGCNAAARATVTSPEMPCNISNLRRNYRQEPADGNGHHHRRAFRGASGGVGLCGFGDVVGVGTRKSGSAACNDARFSRALAGTARSSSRNCSAV